MNTQQETQVRRYPMHFAMAISETETETLRELAAAAQMEPAEFLTRKIRSYLFRHDPQKARDYMAALSGSRRRVLEAYVRAILANERSPTIREVCAEVGLRSSCTIQRHIDWLVDAGYLTRAPCQMRGIRLGPKLAALQEPQL